MSWPLSHEFNEAIQNPATAFTDSDLKSGNVIVGPQGIPLPHSGNFADVYQLRAADGRDWAVKCFTRPVWGMAERYAALSESLARADLPFTIGFSYLAEGIQVGGQWRPIVKMEWVEGLLLNQVIRDNVNRPQTLISLTQMWAKLCKRLRDAEITHADLQHGNVMMVPGSRPGAYGLKLIDYDGMYVPALANKPPGETGHSSYQHPARITMRVYSSDVDRFPHLVIATAMRGVAARGQSLWDRYDNGDNLLFTEADFRKPNESRVMRELWETEDPAVQSLVGRLAIACGRAIPETPWLDEIMIDGEPKPLDDATRRDAIRVLGIGRPIPTSEPQFEVVETPKTAAQLPIPLPSSDPFPTSQSRSAERKNKTTVVVVTRAQDDNRDHDDRNDRDDDARYYKKKRKPKRKQSGNQVILLAGGGVLLLVLAAVVTTVVIAAAKQREPEYVQREEDETKRPIISTPKGPDNTSTPSRPKKNPEPVEGKISEPIFLGSIPNDPTFKTFGPEGSHLIGLEVRFAPFADFQIARAVRPIYRVKGKEEFGKQFGNDLRGAITYKAKDGYAVGGITGEPGSWCTGFSLTYMKVKPDGTLDPNDRYESEWGGHKSDNVLHRMRSDGTPVIGIVGKIVGTETTALGLLLKGQENYKVDLLEPVENPPMTPERPDPNKPQVIAMGREPYILGTIENDPKFKTIGPNGAILIGVEARFENFGDTPIVRAVRPIYRINGKEGFGQQFGDDLKGSVTLKAKEGYAVGGITGKAGWWCNGFSLTFMKVKPDGTLNPNDSYVSEWAGFNGQSEIFQVISDGVPAIGIVGKIVGTKTTALGLLFKGQENFDPNQKPDPRLPFVQQPDKPQIVAFGKDSYIFPPKEGNPKFRTVGPKDSILIGVEVKISKFGLEAVRAIRPIYRINGKEEFGKQFGHELKDSITVKAKDGYAIGGMTAKADEWHCIGFSLTFMKVKADGTLDSTDSYESGWIGHNSQAKLFRQTSDGAPAVGIVGTMAGHETAAFGIAFKGQNGADPDPANPIEGEWTRVTEGMKEVWTIRNNGKKWEVSGRYFEKDKEVGGFIGLNPKFANGKIVFLQSFTKPPPRVWLDKATVTLELSDNVLNYTWAINNATGTRPLTRLVR